MIIKKRDLTELAVYEMNNDADTLFLETLKPLYMVKTAEIVYVTRENKLYGIVCLGEVLRSHNGRVKINTNFVRLADSDIIAAREIFHEKGNIFNIPIINEQGKLTADYSRCNDDLFMERNLIWLKNKKIFTETLRAYKMVYMVEPNDSSDSNYLFFIHCLSQFEIKYMIIKKNNCGKKFADEDILLFLNEGERRETQFLLQVDLEGERPKNFQRHEAWMTYKNFLTQMLKERDLEIVKKLGNFSVLPDKNVDQKASLLFSQLRKAGVNCLAIYADNSSVTEYAKCFNKRLSERLQKSPCMQEPPWITGETAEKFWGELYLSEDYKCGIVQKELLDGWLKGRYENLHGKYCKTKNGRRVTCNQPKEYIGTIYFLGPCLIFGAYAEDRYTIENYLQKMLLENGYPYRVENCASPLRLDSELESRLMEIDSYSPHDMVIYLTQAGEVAGVENCLLWDIYEQENVSTDWVTNWYLHCNHKVNKIIASHILKRIEANLFKKKEKQKSVHIDFRGVMEKYVYHKYLTKYFADYFNNNYGTVGAIVMNCNPFSLGHRYLIEQAQKQVDYLIIFLVEEDESQFSFEERYKMITDGINDLKNIKVVPSGEFILSKNTFQEYFTKVETELICLNAEYDIQIFSDYIAPPLHITYRFAGEEPVDRVTKIYNEAMEKILPQKGISFVEIPRRKMENEIISASRVREYLKRGEYNMAAKLLPESTFSFLTT